MALIMLPHLGQLRLLGGVLGTAVISNWICVS